MKRDIYIVNSFTVVLPHRDVNIFLAVVRTSEIASSFTFEICLSDDVACYRLFYMET